MTSLGIHREVSLWVWSWSALLFVFLICLFLPFNLAHAEAILEMESEITVGADSAILITESITYDFGSNERHGIFRFIPHEHPEPASVWYKERYIDISVESVLRNGKVEPYEITANKKETNIRIGDPNQTISGIHTYEITYVVTGGLSYHQNQNAELYWNVNGDAWEVRTESVRVTLIDKDGIFTNERACYRDVIGGSGSCDRTSIEAAGIVFESQNLRPGEVMTVAQGINQSKVTPVVLERTEYSIFVVPFILLWFLLLGIAAYRYKTAHRIQNTVIAQYEPYEHFKPMYTGLLFDGRLDPRDITAGIVYLAEQGFLKIERIESTVLFFIEVEDFKLSLIKDPRRTETRFQQDLLTLLFGERAAVGSTVTLSELKKNHTKQRENQKLLQKLKKDLEQDLKNAGFFQINFPKRYMNTLEILLLVGFWVWVTAEFPIITELNIFIGAVVLLGSIAILLSLYRRRTKRGYEALNHLEGFKQFLSVTEKERYAFHNAPEKSPEQFMQFLPYAIAFGVEQKWAAVFKDVTIPDPTWYDRGNTGTPFSATSITTSLGAFSTAFAQSTGSSASSGGGSAGGGGGGGGGGSW